MKRIILYLLWMLAIAVHAEDISLSSPDNKITLDFRMKQGVPVISIDYQKENILPEIRLGLQTTHSNFGGNLTFTGYSEIQEIHEDYQAVHGKKKHRTNQGNATTLFLKDTKGKKLSVEFRVYNDGVCFRYHIGESSDSLRFTEELTTYRFAEGTTWWLQDYVPHYEGDYLAYKENLKQGEWGYPALVRKGNHWALITEADMGRTYCGTHLSNREERHSFQTVYPHEGEGNGKGDVHPCSQAPWHSPWRVILLGSLKDIVESTLVEDVCPPCRIGDTDWIQPGSAAWVYWAYNHGTKDYQICCNYVDLAARMNWEYVLFDWEWDQMSNGGNLKDAVRYAYSKGVKPLIWYNSGGDHNRVSSTPRDRLVTRESRNKEFAKLKEMGFAGVKVDFFESDKQHMMNYYIDILEDAAKHKLMVNFHGSTIPRGWSRTYPHLISMEAVYGAEQYNNSPYMTTAAPRLNCTYPFTRNVIGPMDYTPIAFTHSQHPHHTTYAHELALGIVFESGIQHWADRPKGFFQLSPETRKMLGDLPTAWDETRLIDGYPGNHVVIARRKGEVWYIAGINGTDQPRSFDISLDFLPSDKKYRSIQFTDGTSAQQIKNTRQTIRSSKKLDIDCLPFGGFVIQVIP